MPPTIRHHAEGLHKGTIDIEIGQPFDWRTKVANPERQRFATNYGNVRFADAVYQSQAENGLTVFQSERTTENDIPQWILILDANYRVTAIITTPESFTRDQLQECIHSITTSLLIR